MSKKYIMKITLNKPISMETINGFNSVLEIIGISYKLDFKEVEGVYVRCPECHEPNKMEEWDKSTRKVFWDRDITPLQAGIGRPDLLFICPACSCQFDGDELEVEDE